MFCIGLHQFNHLQDLPSSFHSYSSKRYLIIDSITEHEIMSSYSNEVEVLSFFGEGGGGEQKVSVV